MTDLNKDCPHCGAIISRQLEVCPFCNSDLTFQITEKYKDASLKEIIQIIDEAFFRLELFMNGNINQYQYFGFYEAFKSLFEILKQPENLKFENQNLVEPYISLLFDISYRWDKGILNCSFENEDFNKDINEIDELKEYELHNFGMLDLETNTDLEYKPISINDIIEERQTVDNPSPQPDPIRELPENKFDSTDMQEVYNYFKTHLVDCKRMSEADLIKYLKDAFELQKPPVKRYKIKTDTNTRIRKVFYQYYKEIAGKPYGRQSEYLNLLKDYFIGFEKELTRNFSK